MAYRRKRRVDTSTSYLTGIPTFSKIGSMVKKLIASSQYDFFEGEAFEVTEVILNESNNRGSVRGTFINNPNQEILGGVVKSLTPNITTVPVIGEHVVVTEYNGQHYYTSIINRKGSVNENSIPGVSGNYVKDTKYGKTFERKDVKPLEISEGCILFEGRFGQSIHFSNDKQKPQIKIVAGHRGTTENINNDDSSIYLSGGSSKASNEDKKIQIKSNSIFINGSDIRLGSTVESKLEPVVKGDELKKIIDMLLDSAISTKQAEVATKLVASGGVVTPETTQLALEIGELETIKNLPTTPYLSLTVKTT